ncbi:MAG: glycogen debranching enzyme N-terminal domain-containing protein [Planctomycetota bacterium]|jgi:starch synthase (maltosyl-transferring)|nr:glycogen debranching enzyme N-terminal domain-containing protein [Planctomycetota bacterium]
MPLHPEMLPATGSRQVRHVGDSLELRLRLTQKTGDGWQARVRTSLGCDNAVRRELAEPITGEPSTAAASIRDVAMTRLDDGDWICRFTLTEPGFHRFKAFVVDPDGVAHWPQGDDAEVCVHPAWTRSGNTLYCAFPRMFGATRNHRKTRDPLLEDQLALLDRHGYTAIPPSGTLRDLTRELDHIIDRLGCRILHLLPINPTPTTMAKYGRFGSPYAALEFTAVDPALVEHDKHTTGIEQFQELADGVHHRGARLFLDLAINHTGWGSWLYERHPEWFQRNDDGSFHSPGAWGVTWEDLVELDSEHRDLWEHLAQAFLTWCERGVDGFRCDAGYMIPMPVWRAIIARVQQDFPDTVFLLEGLGGAWDATNALLGEGRMQWAYSELFQNYTAAQIATYNEHSLRANTTSGLLFHYAETHDNDRLAAKGRAWSLFRNRISALLSQSGGYGFTCGVEWLADEKLQVHQSRGLNWGADENIVLHIATLTRILCAHPAFRDGARCTRVSQLDGPIYALHRHDADGNNHVVVVANADSRHEHRFRLPGVIDKHLGAHPVDLTEPSCPPLEDGPDGDRYVVLAPLRCACLAADRSSIEDDAGADYRATRHRHAAAVSALAQVLPPEHIAPAPWQELAVRYGTDPFGFLMRISHIKPEAAASDLIAALDAVDAASYPTVIKWATSDARRITPVPHDHWLLLHDREPFRFRVTGNRTLHGRSTRVDNGYVAWIAPDALAGDAKLALKPMVPDRTETHAALRFLDIAGRDACAGHGAGTVLLTNGRGGMARIGTDLVSVRSKYDCILGANLHELWPVDRHVLAKRLRLWLISDHFSAPIDASTVENLEPGPPAVWRLRVPAGGGRMVAMTVSANMLNDRNETVFRIRRDGGDGVDPVRLVARVDLEDRSFHAETIHSPAADAHFLEHLRPLDDGSGFRFVPAHDRQVLVQMSGATFHREGEWCHGIGHPLEGERGQHAQGDAYSPGWFETGLVLGETVELVLNAESDESSSQQRDAALARNTAATGFSARLHRGLDAYVVRREDGSTVIAGYPWFLDWGRDTLICARGLLSAGKAEEVRGILAVFGAFEQGGTLPNCIHGADASNRETSDAALWYGVVAEEFAANTGLEFYQQAVTPGGRSYAEVLRSIALGHLAGCSTGVCVDADSGLVWSPSHFTWMDTNHPAGTPRVGYPIEIQVLWWRLLRQLAQIDAEPAPGAKPWQALADQVADAIHARFWLESEGWWSDCLHAKPGVSAAQAVVDTSLRSNCLHVIALDLDTGPRAQRCVSAAARYLAVPGALRSLAPLPVFPPLHIRNDAGENLVDPNFPYRGFYHGDEDTSRKPAYHNGTAWTWPFPVFCEALAKAWDSDSARKAARSYLGSMDRLLSEGCRGQIPEIIDGDAPHAQRGCDAQAWGVTEAVRLLHLLEKDRS